MTKIEVKTKLRLKGYFIIFLQFLLIPYGAFLSYIIFLVNTSDNGTTFYICFLLFGILVDIIFILMFITVFKRTMNNVTYVTISKKGIQIKRPLKFYSQFYDWAEIKGYSKTDYVYIGGKSQASCKAIIIYTRSKITYEIIEVYNSNYLNFQKHLNTFNVAYFGTEKYERGRFGGRKQYKFQDSYNL